jgi:hypothetical protein
MELEELSVARLRNKDSYSICKATFTDNEAVDTCTAEDSSNINPCPAEGTGTIPATASRLLSNHVCIELDRALSREFG